MKRRSSRKKVKGVVRMIDASKVQVPTKLLHSNLNPMQSALARYTWEHCGKFMYAAYEQWENGFLREPYPDRELLFWLMVAKACEGRSFSDVQERKEFIGSCVLRGVAKVIPWAESFVHSDKLEPWLDEILAKYAEPEAAGQG